MLVCDLTILMQDWDFPHFTNTLDVNLPGFYKHMVTFQAVEIQISGKHILITQMLFLSNIICSINLTLHDTPTPNFISRKVVQLWTSSFGANFGSEYVEESDLVQT